jgi:hypothetical protein
MTYDFGNFSRLSGLLGWTFNEINFLEWHPLPARLQHEDLCNSTDALFAVEVQSIHWPEYDGG